ncbi:unnamed protein product [Rangifer tarandus platyrhynchus]|uniref:Uncharacterized protein n=2 Tax=Rangifer tarandus platyrhynchus TaxID=3082113 RepID=A0AC59Y3Q3_RANTA|nr:unnamed protein product [Rangifer tarandus platyrhynchus]
MGLAQAGAGQSLPSTYRPEEKSTPTFHLHPPPRNASASPQPAPTGQIKGQHWGHTHPAKALGSGALRPHFLSPLDLLLVHLLWTDKKNLRTLSPFNGPHAGHVSRDG